MRKALIRLFLFRRLKQQLAWIFLILTSVVLGVFGTLAYNRASTSLEEELALRLLTVAKLKARAMQGFDPLALLPGGAAVKGLREKAGLLAKDAGLESLQILKPDGTVIIDTKDPSNEGQPYGYLDLELTEWDSALKGLARATPLFRGRGGRLFKSALAPVYDQDSLRAVLRVEASADFLAEVRRFGWSLIALGGLSLIFAVGLAALVSKPIVDPVRELAAASRRVAAGDFSARVAVHRQDEIGQMSETFNEMAERLGTFVREKERMATLGELAAGVVHEIRNPLAAIEGFAQLVEARLKPRDPGRSHLKDIRNEVRIVNGFLSDFLEFAKPREPRLERLNPVDVAASALAVVLPGDRAKRWKARWEKRDKVLVRADADQLRQVFVNLLMNAREASPSGGALRLGCERSGGKARIWVRDEGRGISKADLQKLFTPFFTSKPMGTGLGLSIAQKITESFGGHIEAESSQGKGSCFTVVLPIKN